MLNADLTCYPKIVICVCCTLVFARIGRNKNRPITSMNSSFHSEKEKLLMKNYSSHKSMHALQKGMQGVVFNDLINNEN